MVRNNRSGCCRCIVVTLLWSGLLTFSFGRLDLAWSKAIDLILSVFKSLCISRGVLDGYMEGARCDS